VKSTTIAGFQTLLNSFWEKLFGWPDLFRFSSSSVFLFQAVPLGPPSFDSEVAGGPNVISGNMTQPLNLKMFSPLNGGYEPYVEFNTTLTGPTTLTLDANGQINFQMAAATEPVTYSFADSYVQEYSPNTYIAAGTIGNSAFKALNTSGVQLTIPPLSVGASLKLQPADWALLPGDVLQLEFSTTSSAPAPVVAPVAPANAPAAVAEAPAPATAVNDESYSRGR
jgi:hypothetical protein